jgi:transcriptional regulator GlxA family with amidase domain
VSAAPHIGAEPDRPDFAVHVRGALALAIISDYSLASAGADRSASLPTGLAAVKHHLDNRFAEPCTTSDLAAIADLNPTYLIDRFRREFGMPPARYLWQRRVEAGVRLLQQTRLSCEEIAHLCGFQSAAHFSRKVKALRQATPRELRGEFVRIENRVRGT